MNLDPTPSITELADLQSARQDFPDYQIDIDLALDRRRFIARRTQPGPGPHTLITSDLTELCAELTPASSPRRSRAGGHPVTDPHHPGQPHRWTTILDGAQLRRLRRQAALSQERLADRAGVSPATVARLERQHCAPCRSRTLARLAAALHTEPAALTPARRAERPRDPLAPPRMSL